MTVIKEWDGTQWVPIVVGKQGPQGTTGSQGPQGSAGSTPPGDDAEYVLALQVFS
jgi:hypothetical protein